MAHKGNDGNWYASKEKAESTGERTSLVGLAKEKYGKIVLLNLRCKRCEQSVSLVDFDGWCMVCDLPLHCCTDQENLERKHADCRIEDSRMHKLGQQIALECEQRFLAALSGEAFKTKDGRQIDPATVVGP